MNRLDLNDSKFVDHEIKTLLAEFDGLVDHSHGVLPADVKPGLLQLKRQRLLIETFEQARPSGWDERAGVLHEDTGLPGFVAGVKALLGASDADRGGASSA